MTDIIVYQPHENELAAAVEIIRTAHPASKEIPEQIIRAGALLALQVGANPNPLSGELYIYPIQGRYAPYLGIAFYRRVAEEQNARVMFVPDSRGSNEPRAMTDEERKAHHVPDNVDASICRGFRGDRLLELLDRGVPWKDAAELLARVGVGYLRDEEKKGRDGKYINPPNGRSWQWKCDKRAEMDLYRKLGVTARTVEQAQAAAAEIAAPPLARPQLQGYTVNDFNREIYG